MKDILEVDLAVGNLVVIRKPNYSGLLIGKIIKITPQKIRVQYVNNWNYDEPGKIQDILVHQSDCCKVDGPDALAYALKHNV